MLISMLFAHFLGDFAFQTHKMASNKARDFKALNAHVMAYSLIVTAVFAYVARHYPYTTIEGLNPHQIYMIMVGAFFFITYMLHFVTDAVTSRITSALFQGAMHHYDQTKYAGQFGTFYHNYFVVIGFDQFLHALALWGTLWYFGFPVS